MTENNCKSDLNEAVQDVAKEIDKLGDALVRYDIAEAMIASGEFERWEGHGQATGFVPLRRKTTRK